MNELTALEQYILDNNRVWPFPTYEAAAISDRGSATYCITKTDFLERIAEENRPSFSDHLTLSALHVIEAGDGSRVRLSRRLRLTGLHGSIQKDYLQQVGYTYKKEIR